jgi:hypothetical protein
MSIDPHPSRTRQRRSTTSRGPALAEARRNGTASRSAPSPSLVHRWWIVAGGAVLLAVVLALSVPKRKSSQAPLAGPTPAVSALDPDETVHPLLAQPKPPPPQTEPALVAAYNALTDLFQAKPPQTEPAPETKVAVPPMPPPAEPEPAPAPQGAVVPALAGNPEAAPTSPAVARGEDNCGTSVKFLSNPDEAARKAKRDEKLLFLLHVSGNFEDRQFT